MIAHFFPKQIIRHFKNVKYWLFYVAIKSHFDNCQFRIWIFTSLTPRARVIFPCQAASVTL